MKYAFFIGIAIIIVLAVSLFSAYIKVNDHEITLREQVVAQQDVCEANFDKMFKVISQVAGVATEYQKQSKEAFKEIYPALMEGRYSNDRGGALMSWVTESNPQFDMAASAGLYKKLQTAIEANRQEYFIQQKKLIDLKRAHSRYIKTFWNRNLFGLYSRGEIDIIIITSAKTKEAYSTGEENDLELFE